MVGGLDELKAVVQDALDDICSPRTSPEVKTNAFERLEKQLASSCLLNDEDTQSRKNWDYLLALQYTFECNIPSRLVTWIAACTPRLEPSLNRGTPEPEHALPLQIARALTIIQGIALTHDSSKVYLGRRYCLEVFLDLLLTSRHLATPTSTQQDKRADSGGRIRPPTELPLTSIVLDTLLCILVDSYQSLRTFEDSHGVQAVVKILKRAGTPREVRMKCLEFIYFYLLDETLPTESASNQEMMSTSTSQKVDTAATAVPTRAHSKPSLNATPVRPLSRHGSETSSSSSASSRSTSGSSMHSFTSASSASTSTTPPNTTMSTPSMPLSPIKSRPSVSLRTPFQGTPQSSFRFPTLSPGSNSPYTPGFKLSSRRIDSSQDDMLMMLKKDVDYEPMSPRKPTSNNVGSNGRDRVSTPTSRPRSQTHGQIYTPSRNYTHSSQSSQSLQMSQASISFSINSSISSSVNVMRNDSESHSGSGGVARRKTTEEKKMLLGTMLGNVDALVDTVRKAGIWGLS